jgi:transcriptional regulator with PAS, ATPase and Fis domain
VVRRTHSIHTRQVTRGDKMLLRRRRLRLEVLAGPDKKLRRDFDGERVVVGTHASCDLVLTDSTVSRQHLEIELVRSGWLVRDLDSTNGTYVGELRVGEVMTTDEVRLRLGRSELRLRPLDDTVDLPLVDTQSFGPLRGRSPAMRRVFEVLARLAPTDLTVLVTGESGTGKELAARAIHEASPRRGGPFVVVDCGALPPTLIESALYGHERGAFTGAERARRGAFEEATGGTLFLDEIGELPLELQTRLLGVIERRQVQPLGSTRPRAVDVRLVAATNRDLRREVNRGAFREDLYFRLAVGTVHLPPLRDRPEDIELYVADFVAEQAEVGRPVTIGADTIARLMLERWPGNVRELRNALERAAALGAQDLALAPVTAPVGEELSFTVDAATPYKTEKALLLEQFEKMYVSDLMRRHEDNITRAARAAEIDRVYLLRLLDKFGMRPGRKG